MNARNRTPAWLIRAWVDQRVTMREALELRPYAWVLGRPELHGIRQGGGGTPVRGGAAKDPPGADPYAAPGLREVPTPVSHEGSLSGPSVASSGEPLRSYRLVLRADVVDVINAALFMAAPLLDEGLQSRWGGGANVRRVQAEFFAALEVARGEDSPSAGGTS